jgi:hypothetical protein
MTEPLEVFVSVDLDPDPQDDSSADTLSWTAVDDICPRIADVLASTRGDDGAPATATWFVRSDDRVAAAHDGHTGWLVEHLKPLLTARQSAGDCIGWHPHIEAQDDRGWRNAASTAAMPGILKRGAAAFQAQGFKPECTRMGGNAGSHDILSTLEELGVRVDSSAMPGRARQDEIFGFDWMTTPAKPYRPSRSDYRRPGDPAFLMTEVPLTMLPIKAPYDCAPVTRYVDLSFRNEFLAPALKTVIATAECLVTIMHPAALFPSPTPHGLLAHSFDVFERNLASLFDQAHKLGRTIRFATLDTVSAP